MMRHTRLIQILILAQVGILIAISPIEAQYTSCNYIDSLSGTTLSNTTTIVEYKIQSKELIINPSQVIYDAGNSICLDSGFEIKSGALLNAYVDGCKRECEPSIKLCEDNCTSTFDDDSTSSGQRFAKFQAVLTFPDSIVGIGTSRTLLTVNGKDYDVSDTLRKYLKPVDSMIVNFGELSRCLCDRNIFLYENSNLIFEEGAIKRRNKKVGGVKSEGGIWSLNYILETQDAPLPIGTVPVGAGVDDRANPNPIVAKMIAMLDSGIEAEAMPDNSLYYNMDPASYVCLLQDPGGWNFIDNNDDISDPRGHGTIVALSYFNAFSNIKPSTAISAQQLLTVKVLNDCGEGTTYSTLCGMRYAEKKGAKIINTSWGMYQNDWQMQRTVEELGDLDITIVSSAGNQGVNLEDQEHFPSGFGAEFNYIIEEDSIFTSMTFDHVYEVGGICLNINYACGMQPSNMPLSSTSNTRNFIFAEPSINIQELIPGASALACEINGTSYAAPQLMAAIAILQIASGGPVSKTTMKNESQLIHPDRQHYSYRLKNCE